MNKGGVRPLVIYGTGDTATLVYSIAIEAGIEVAAVNVFVAGLALK